MTRLPKITSEGKLNGKTDLWILLLTMGAWLALVMARSVLFALHVGDAANSLNDPILVLTGFFVGHKLSDKVDRTTRVEVGKVISPATVDDSETVAQ